MSPFFTLLNGHAIITGYLALGNPLDQNDHQMKYGPEKLPVRIPSINTEVDETFILSALPLHNLSLWALTRFPSS